MNSIERMWKEYLYSIGEDIKTTKLKYESWSFGDNRELGDSLAQLVLKGDKRATTSLYYLYEVENEELPKVGDIGIITDFDKNAKCIIRTSKVTVLPFEQVGAEFAYREGEGDKSLEYWRKAHSDVYNRRLKDLNMKFSKEMLVVCEEFEVIYK